MRKVIVYIATSLDGYIATESDSLDWLFKVEGEGDNGYAAFYETVDTILMGRRTYDWIMEVEKSKFPYPEKECFVFSRTAEGSDVNVTYVNENIVHFVETLRGKAGGTIWVVGGGAMMLDLLKANCIDEYILNVAPVILGKGIPLFLKQDTVIQLELKTMTRHNQFVELHYVKKGESSRKD